MGAQCWVAAEDSRNWRKLVNLLWNVLSIYLTVSDASVAFLQATKFEVPKLDQCVR